MNQECKECLEEIRLGIWAGVLYLVVRDEIGTQSPLLAFAVCGAISMCLVWARQQNIQVLWQLPIRIVRHIFSRRARMTPNSNIEQTFRPLFSVADFSSWC